MIGPYKFSVKQLEKAGVIVNSASIANQYALLSISFPPSLQLCVHYCGNRLTRNNVSIKMSCTNPGSVNITTKVSIGKRKSGVGREENSRTTVILTP